MWIGSRNTLRISIYVLLIFIITNTSTAQRLDSTSYQPISLHGRIPEDFLKCVQGVLTVPLPLGYDNKKFINEKFNSVTAIQLRQIFLNGYVYYNDTLSVYSRQVLQKLLANKPEINKKIHVFVTRLSAPNAMTWQDGTVLINVGLLAKMQNEAQLAFVLGHEITHFLHNHAYQQYILAQGVPPPSDVKGALSVIQYSNLNEVYADSVSLQLMAAAGYPPQEAIAALRLLETYTYEPLNLPASLSSAKVTVSERELCTPAKARNYTRFGANMRTPEGTPTITIDSRVSAILKNMAVLPKSETKTDTEQAKTTAGNFALMRQFSQFEVIEDCYQQGDFIRTTYDALALLRQYPKNKYLVARAMNGMHGIAAYSKIGKLSDILFDRFRTDDIGLARMYCFLRENSDNYIQQIAYYFVAQMHQKYSGDEEVLFAMAQATELYLGLDHALPFYKDYIAKYPKGTNSAIVQLKITSQ